MNFLKQVLTLTVTPAIIATHYYTQWQGLLNVWGTILVLVALLELVVVIAVMFTDFEPPAQPKRSVPFKWATWFIAGGSITYLMWFGHIFVGSVYVLAVIMSLFIRAVSKKDEEPATQAA